MGVAPGVGIRVGVAVGVGVRDGVAVGVGVRDGDGVAVGVGVAVGDEAGAIGEAKVIHRLVAPAAFVAVTLTAPNLPT